MGIIKVKMRFLPAFVASVAAADKIKVELYYESQCPGCKMAITTSFNKAMNTEGFTDMAEVTLVPYGNAHEMQKSDKWEFSCQHGALECSYNLVESCALNNIKCEKCAFNFVDCVEPNTNKRDFLATAKTCAEPIKCEDNLYERIETCVNVADGNKFEHQM